MPGESDHVEGPQTRVVIDGQQGGKEQGTPGQQEQGQLHRRVIFVPAPPYQNQRVHRHHGDFVEEEEQEQIERHEDAVHADDQHQHEGEEFLHPLPEIPHRQHAGEKDDGVQHDENGAEAIHPQVIGDADVGDPGN